MKNKNFSIIAALREGWELTKVNIGFLITYQIILIFLALLFTPFNEIGVLSAFVAVIGWLIITLGKMGFFQSSLMLTKGLKPSLHQFYSNWPLFLPWIVSAFLFIIMFSVGLALFIIPGLWVWSIFGFFPFFILDKGMGPVEALKKSADATQGIRLHALLLFLACAGLNILGLICFGVGLLITAPVTLIAITVVYRKITGQGNLSIQPSDILEE